ncbi:MAG: hypothetical protein KA419_16840 [Acidobacteria bacterium]|nr:hypothetical protein [Acidobacteriota bacterium]
MPDQDSRGEFHILFYDNTNQNLDLLPQTKIALFARKVEPAPGNLDPRKFAAYMTPYLIMSGMIIKDVMARKGMKVLINSFYNYLKPTRYDMLILDRTRIIHTFNAVEEFFYDILYPDDKGKTRPLEKTPLRDPAFLSSTMSNTQFIRENPIQGEMGLADRMNANLDIGVQIFHFEKLHTIYDKLNNIIIPEEKAISAIKEDPDLKKHIIKVDLRKYCLASLDEVAFERSKIYSLRGHYIIAQTFYNNKNIDAATYLILDKPVVINTRELCTNPRIMETLVSSFLNEAGIMDDREVINMVNQQVSGKSVMNFLNISPELKISFLNKEYLLLDKECMREDTGMTKIIPARKFVANMYEAKYFIEIIRKD